ncbi:hypothetical protein [Roseovarius salinarum]|uniref:hypothetical protein n=1 Tax=Roseovarius salinarum TaxID=1981892 RepID=UPI0012FFFD3C|nr:hypothetical protein [Roseovarius salinarum]
MQVDNDLKERVRHAIIDRFEPGVIRDVRLESIEIDEDEEEIRLIFTIETDADPGMIGRRFFGLTDKVRKALGEDWRGYFPILQSEIDRGVAA